MYKSQRVGRSTRRDLASQSHSLGGALKKSGASVLFRGRINTSWEYARRGTQRAVIHHTRKVHAAVVPACTRAIRSVHTGGQERGAHPVKVCEIQVLSTPRQLAAITQSRVGAGVRVGRISRLASPRAPRRASAGTPLRAFSPGATRVADTTASYFSGRRDVRCRPADVESRISPETSEISSVWLAPSCSSASVENRSWNARREWRGARRIV